MDFLDFLLQMIHGDLIDKFMVGFLATIVLVVVALVLWLGVYLVDTVGVKPFEKMSTVTGKNYSPMRTVTTTIMVNKVLVPTTTVIPESYELELKPMGNSRDHFYCEVDRYFYEEVNVGQTLIGQYKTGRLTSGTYCVGARSK